MTVWGCWRSRAAVPGWRRPSQRFSTSAISRRSAPTHEPGWAAQIHLELGFQGQMATYKALLGRERVRVPAGKSRNRAKPGGEECQQALARGGAGEPQHHPPEHTLAERHRTRRDRAVEGLADVAMHMHGRRLDDEITRRRAYAIVVRAKVMDGGGGQRAGEIGSRWGNECQDESVVRASAAEPVRMRASDVRPQVTAPRKAATSAGADSVSVMRNPASEPGFQLPDGERGAAAQPKAGADLRKWRCRRSRYQLAARRCTLESVRLRSQFHCQSRRVRARK